MPPSIPPSSVCQLPRLPPCVVMSAALHVRDHVTSPLRCCCCSRRGARPRFDSQRFSTSEPGSRQSKQTMRKKESRSPCEAQSEPAACCRQAPPAYSLPMAVARGRRAPVCSSRHCDGKHNYFGRPEFVCLHPEKNRNSWSLLTVLGALSWAKHSCRGMGGSSWATTQPRWRRQRACQTSAASSWAVRSASSTRCAVGATCLGRACQVKSYPNLC
jgi:hypothetical protein